MSSIHKSHSYPERLKDAETRHNIETINTFKEKDYERTLRLASLGSPSSHDIVVHTTCCGTLVKAINYFLERDDNTDEILRRKSYAGFYYFIKWFVRALFLLVFTTLGTIAGKEIGCEIKDHDTCKSGVVELADSSPHIVASILGFVFGLVIGQWLGRLL